MEGIVRKLTLLLALLLGPGLTHAQTPTGTIQGTVTDQQGGAVVGATVIVTNNATGISKQVVSDSAGRFEMLFVLPGTYTVTADAKGFRQEKRENVVVEVSEILPLALSLTVGQASQTIEVVGTTGTIETDSSSV